jgi:carbon-monoxide dehydrogenase medium subunit
MEQIQVVNLFRPQTYHRAKSVADAASFLAQHENGVVIAGGTDLLVEKNTHTRSLVDITKLNLSYVRPEEKLIRIGACTTFRHIEHDATLTKQPYSSLVEAARTIGGVSIRNEATVGGNVCNAVPSADSPPPLLVLDTKVEVSAQSGKRIVDLQDFFVNVRKTALNRGEFVTEFQIPRPPLRTGTSFIKLGRSAHDIAVVNAAVRITLGKDQEIDAIRIVLGAVAPVPLRARKAEEKLKSEGIDAIAEVASTAAEETKPISDVRASAEYRRAMSAVLVKRALMMAIERSQVM